MKPFASIFGVLAFAGTLSFLSYIKGHFDGVRQASVHSLPKGPRVLDDVEKAGFDRDKPRREKFDDGRPAAMSSKKNGAPSGRTTSPHYKKEPLVTQANDAPATINEHGFITSSVVARAGLSDEEKGIVQSMFSEHRRNMQKLIQRNMSEDNSKSNPELGLRAFVIKPFAAEGRAEYDQFASYLDSTVGYPRRNIILQGYPDTEFFDYGRNEALIRLFCGDAGGNLLAPGDDTTNIRTMERAEVIFYDPDSGRSLGKSSCSLKSLTEAVGDIFSDSEDQ